MSKRNPSVGQLGGELPKLVLVCPADKCEHDYYYDVVTGDYKYNPFQGKVLEMYRHFRNHPDRSGHGMTHTVAYMKLIALISLSIEFNKVYHNSDRIQKRVADLKASAFKRLAKGLV